MKTFNLIKLSCILMVVYIIVILNSCSLYESKVRDCYDIGRELTEEEKNIFPYKVGDSVFFTDGETDYYIYCDRIIDTIYTVNQVGDQTCEGEIDRDDEHIQFISFKTDIPLYDNAKSFNIIISPNSIKILMYKYSGSILNRSSYELSMLTERLLENMKINTSEYEFQLYHDSIYLNSIWFYNVYQLSNSVKNHCVDTCYLNKEHGILKFTLCTNQKIIVDYE